MSPSKQLVLKGFNISHQELVILAEKWLKGAGRCKFSFSELAAYSNFEIPDAIGFDFYNSTLIECKTSRSDFKADSKKIFRKIPANGMGLKRFYLCPKGMISKDELPQGWGLLIPSGKSCRKIVNSKFNWTSKEKSTIRWNERYLLVKALHRFGIRLNGDFRMIYDMDWNPIPLRTQKYWFKKEYLGSI